jgi:enamine deaminase RidA (YjgF/YER057c/UK114 family)
MYITDINYWEEAGKAHGEVFHTIKPASTLIAVSALVDERLLIEIEATAYIPTT